MSNSVNQQRETLSVTYVWMSVTFCVCLVVSNIFIPRLWQVGPLPVQLTGAVLLFPISYIPSPLRLVGITCYAFCRPYNISYTVPYKIPHFLFINSSQ